MSAVKCTTPATRPPEVNGRFVNLDGTTPDKSGWAVAGWLVRHRLADELRQGTTALLDLFRRQGSRRPPFRPNPAAALDPDHPHLTWISHSTFLMRLGGHWILTDPVFGRPAWTLWRHCPPGLAPDRLPEIDVVTLSHDHYDHLDLPSLAALKGKPQLIAPLRLGRHLPRPRRPIELDWWETHARPGLGITLVPAHHWSMRGPSSRNRTLWGGFVYEADGMTIYFAGDTAFKPKLFESIHQRFPRIDLAILPIGAYAPRWFMQAQHMDPDEAVAACELLAAERIVAMHWGTFHLSSEPPHEPPDRLRAAWTARGHPANRLWIMDIGETRRI